MEGLLAIIALVFGVLNIILFFKIWGMTNNVKLLVKHFTEGTKCKDVGGEIRLAKMRGMPHSQIQEMLVERMSAEIIKEFYSGNGGIGNVTLNYNYQSVGDINNSSVHGVNVNGKEIHFECPFDKKGFDLLINTIEQNQRNIETFQQQINRLITLLEKKYEQ